MIGAQLLQHRIRKRCILVYVWLLVVHTLLYVQRKSSTVDNTARNSKFIE